MLQVLNNPIEKMQERVTITIQGCVQGVGFRPFIYRLAKKHQLVGHICNTAAGVKIDVQGIQDAISKFQNDIVHQKPEGASILEFSVVKAPLCDVCSFQIISSETDAEKSLALLPDTAMCVQCLQELNDPKNRRYQYPFLHCISCGPRFSLFHRMPFDRGNTTMAEFSMCQECKDEYANPTNRRFYSQTNCCPQCGPELRLMDAKKNEIAHQKQALEMAVQYLQQGKIVAMKNTGGYLLLVDATNEQAVQMLRLRKKRMKKPFAMLMPNLSMIDAVAHGSQIERNILTSTAAPIVLLRKKMQNHGIAFSVSEESPYYGVMLPHSPLQHLLFQRFERPLVATSGNISGRPLCISEEDAFDSLASVADVFLIHHRKIRHRLDDSIVHVMADQPVILRKARGYIPCAIENSFQNEEASQNLFAAGSQMKNSFAFLKQGRIYMSQYMGDLDSVESCRAYEEEVSHWETLLDLQNVAGVGDKHPGYYSSEYLFKRNKPSTHIQHHQAHVWSLIADRRIASSCFALAWDGTGWGDDATIWGAEAFLIQDDKMDRMASLFPFALPGNEKAVREPRRSMLGLLYGMFGSEIPSSYKVFLQEAFLKEELDLLLVALQKKINAPLCSSMGRLFDAVSAILKRCWHADFEGHAAMLLEKAAYQAIDGKRVYDMPLIQENGLLLLDWRPMIGQIFEEAAKEVSTADIAMAFHETLAQKIVELATIASKKIVLLTGGVMQNRFLVEKTLVLLKRAGFDPYIHRDIPPNDGGIAVGQLRGIKKEYVSCIAG